jgi:hypothetical protein
LSGHDAASITQGALLSSTDSVRHGTSGPTKADDIRSIGRHRGPTVVIAAYRFARTSHSSFQSTSDRH